MTDKLKFKIPPEEHVVLQFPETNSQMDEAKFMQLALYNLTRVSTDSIKEIFSPLLHQMLVQRHRIVADEVGGIIPINDKQ